MLKHSSSSTVQNELGGITWDNKMSSNMNWICLAIAILSVGAVPGAYNADVSIRQHQSNFYKISEYLESKASKDATADQLMSVAVEWLKSSDQSNNQSPLIESLRLFVSMRELSHRSTCNSRGYTILDNNIQALTNLARYGLRAVDRVGLEYAQRHANTCCGEYQNNFHEKVKGINADELGRVELFAHRISEYALARDDYPMTYGAEKLEDVLKSSPVNYIRLMDDELERKRNRQAEAIVLRDLLQELSGKDELPDGKAGEYFNEYLEQPCQHYVNQIGPDVYKPVVLDEISRLDSRGKVAHCDDGPMDYRLGLAYHKLCEMYILGENNLWSDVVASTRLID